MDLGRNIAVIPRVDPEGVSGTRETRPVHRDAGDAACCVSAAALLCLDRGRDRASGGDSWWQFGTLDLRSGLYAAAPAIPRNCGRRLVRPPVVAVGAPH